MISTWPIEEKSSKITFLPSVTNVSRRVGTYKLPGFFITGNHANKPGELDLNQQTEEIPSIRGHPPFLDNDFES